jgi:chemotaxis protein methyltransferase CheR
LGEDVPPEKFCAAIPEIRPREFAQIRDFAHSTFGLDLRQGKELLVTARLGKHLLAGGFSSFESYFQHVQQDLSGESLHVLIDALTTNHTSFLREPEHFRFLVSDAMKHLLDRRELSIWSAASSTGEEPYTLLFTLLEASTRRYSRVKVFGTDISTRAICAAREATFTEERMRPVPLPWRQKFFKRPGKGIWSVRPEYRPMTEFRRFNLMEPLPASFRFPVIFCRNVMIYFNKKTQTELIRRVTAALEPGGYLFIGHAESLTGIDHGLTYVRPAVYRKPE